MKKKLVWEDTSTRVVLKSVVVGHFAMWVVRQSPYLLPENLDNGIKEFNESLIFKKNLGDEELIKTTYYDLKGKIRDAILNSGIISSWNIAKRGRGPVVVSCHSYPKSDYDFIDLDALARNIAQSVWLELSDDEGFFESRKVMKSSNDNERGNKK